MFYGLWIVLILGFVILYGIAQLGSDKEKIVPLTRTPFTALAIIGFAGGWAWILTEGWTSYISPLLR